jgi:hypothetical protein
MLVDHTNNLLYHFIICELVHECVFSPVNYYSNVAEYSSVTYILPPSSEFENGGNRFNQNADNHLSDYCVETQKNTN